MIKKPLSKNGKKNIMEELRDKLLDWAKQFETPDFIKDDPIFFHISTMIKRT